MDINATVEGMKVLGFEAPKPKDSCDYGIPPGRVRLEDLTCKTAIVKNGANRGAIANFLGYLEKA